MHFMRCTHMYIYIYRELLDTNISRSLSYQDTKAYRSTVIVVFVALHRYWMSLGRQPPTSLIAFWLTALFPCLPFSSHLPHTFNLSLASKAEDSLITLHDCAALQSTTKDGSRRQGGSKEMESGGQTENIPPLCFSFCGILPSGSLVLWGKFKSLAGICV